MQKIKKLKNVVAVERERESYILVNKIIIKINKGNKAKLITVF